MLIPGVQAAKPQKVTLMVDDVPVAQVLQALAEQEKLNLVVSPDVSGTVSLHLTDVPWKQALQTVVKSAGLITRQEGNILSVHSIAWQNNNIARQEAEQARAQANLPLENRSITLQYADAGELAKAGEKLLSAKGSMTVDKRTNRLLLRDNKTALSALEQWVAQMDLPVGQVELSAHIVTINEKSLRELGVKDKPVVTLFNKIDKVDELPAVKDFQADHTLYISAKQETGFEKITDILAEIINQSRIYIEQTIPYAKAGVIQQIRKSGNLLEEEYREDGIFVRAYVDAGTKGLL